MRIIDKNTDFYDFWQGVYPDNSITFDRTDSFLLTKEMLCEHLYYRSYSIRRRNNNKSILALLQICHTFWLFSIDVTKERDNGWPTDYNISLLRTWENHDKPRCMIKFDIIDYNLELALYYARKKSKGADKVDVIVDAINRNDYRVANSIDKHIIRMDDGRRIEKHIPLLKACGIGECVDSLEVYMAFEEYFSLEKSSMERTESEGLTDREKTENHGFDLKTSFRGKV